MLARAAALLAILDGRMLVETGDWELASTLFACSLAVQIDARDWARDVEAEKAEARASAAVALAVVTASAVDERADTLERLRNRLLGYLSEPGVPALWTGDNGLRRRKFKGAERAMADRALESLVNAGAVVFDGKRWPEHEARFTAQPVPAAA
ncbi:hypothetical protein [Nocardia fluminea]|uniref:hypothetical protein n=1 Tax=Nocardia fluminea TaxID=134984 RepID=UPI00341D806B